LATTRTLRWNSFFFQFWRLLPKPFYWNSVTARNPLEKQTLGLVGYTQNLVQNINGMAPKTPFGNIVYAGDVKILSDPELTDT
jgi:hypothetical protein